MRRALPFLLAAMTWSASLRADPPPKVCVAVAGDPDEVARSAADTVAELIARRNDLRGVADLETRRTLQGEAPRAPANEELGTARRSLRGTDADGPVLDHVGTSLGCALFVEVAARPAGTMLRVYDVVHHTFREAVEVANVDGRAVEQVILGALRNRESGPSRRAPPVVPAPAPRSFLQRAWPFAVASGAAALLVAVFFLAQDDGSGTTRVTVQHRGAP